MNLDILDATKIEKTASSVTDKMKSLHKSFDKKFNSNDGVKIDADSDSKFKISKWLGVENAKEVQEAKPDVFDIIKRMNDGTDINGHHTLGLRDLAKFKINPEYKYQNLKQQAGFAAEIISTAKENVESTLKGTGITTYRADDRPDLFPRNDQFVDKIRVDNSGTIIERIQVKFVGSDGADCLSKLASKKFDKYFNGNVDKIEIPKDYYKEIKNGHLIENKISDLQKQLERVKADGNTEAAKKIQDSIDKYNKIGEMIQESSVSSKEALFAREHPNVYMSHTFGVESGLTAAGLTAMVSTVDNVKKFMNGDATALESITDIGKDTAAAGALGYGTGFISSAVTYTMQESSHEFLNTLGDIGAPAAMVTFAVQSYDSISDYATGNIDGKELAYDLGGNATGIAGSMAGSALAGAAVGSVVPGAGTAVGFTAGMVGGMVGYAVSTEAYETAVQFGAENIDEVSQEVYKVGSETLEEVKVAAPEKYDAIKESMNDFAAEHGLPFQF